MGCVRCFGRGIAAWVAVVALPGAVAAQDALSLPNLPAPFVERVWRTVDGLPHDIVWTVLQTRDGYLWLGTQSGLARFDGASFTAFTPEEAPGLSGRAVRALFEDRQGSLWIGTDGAGLFRHGAGRFEKVGGGQDGGGAPGAVVRAIVEDRQGTLWVGSETGLHSIDDDGTVRTRLDMEDLGGDPISALAEDSAGVLWIGTWEGGLLRLDDGQLRRVTTADGLSSNSIRALDVAPDGTLWSATWGGGFDRISRDGAIRGYRVRTADGNRTRAVYVGDSGEVWGGTMNGLVRIQGGGAGAASAADELIGGRVISIAEDREGNFWFGTYNDGLVMLHRDVVDMMDTRNGLRSNNVRAVLEDDDALWIATKGGGLHRLRDGRMEVFTTADGLLSDEVYSLHVDSAGVLWAGTLHGLNRFEGRRFAGLTNGRLRGAIVLAIHRDTEGTVWVGTENAGLNLYEEGVFTPTTDPRLASTTIRSFQTTPDGSLWIGTEERGLFRYQDGAYTTFPGAGPGSSVRGLYTDAEGALWIGTFSDGFSRFKDGELTRFDVGDGLADNQVWQFLEDDDGRIWMSSDRGLFYTNIEQVEARTDSSGTIESEWFGGGREHNGSSQPAAWRARDGRLLFASMAGLVIVDPSRLAVHRPAPPVRIERVVAGDRSVPVDGEEIRLGAVDRDFEIDYTALAMRTPDAVRFRYRLDGYDSDWRDVQTRRTAFFTQVPPGRYTFQVVAYHAHDAWAPVEAALPLRVAPYFYETRWFAALAFSALVLLAVTAYLWRVGHLRTRARRLERQVEERTRDVVREKDRAEAAHATIAEQAVKLEALDRAKSRFFANVSHEFRTPLMLTIGPLEDAQSALPAPPDAGAEVPRKLDMALRNARRLLRLVNQVLDIAKLESGALELHARPADLVPFVRGIAAAFAPIAERKRIAFRVHADVPAVEMAFDANALETVFTNVLSNAFKFTPEGGEIEVVMERDAEPGSGGVVVVRITDSGPGVRPDDLPHVFERFYHGADTVDRSQPGAGIGLSLAKELVELHGGAIRAVNGRDAGVTFTVSLPLGRGDPGTAQTGEGDTDPSEVAAAAPVDVEVASETAPAIEPAARTTGTIDEAQDVTTVLVVDDDADLRTYVRAHLSSRYRVAEAVNGTQGLERAQALVPDLIVSDVAMPELDGYALCHELRASRETDFIPIILLTGGATSEQRIAGLERGADDYVTKPFSMRELEARIDNLIVSRRRLRERFGSGDRVELRSKATDPSASDSEFIERVRSAVEAHLGDPGFGVAELARAAFLDRSHLYRRCQALLGETPSDLIRRLRLEHAARLLSTASGGVGEVAYAVGFASISHFTKCFRDAYQVTPAAYRDQTAPLTHR